MRYTVRRRLGAWQAYHALLCRMLYLVSHAARASCPSCPVACAVVTIAAAATHRHAWPPPPRDRMPHTAAVSQSLWRAPPLAAFRTLVPHTARSSRPACRISHRLPLVSPRFATTASRPHAARDRTLHAARDRSRTPQAARRTPHSSVASWARQCALCHGQYGTPSWPLPEGVCCALHGQYGTPTGRCPNACTRSNTSRILVGRIPDTSGRDARVPLRTYGMSVCLTAD